MKDLFETLAQATKPNTMKATIKTNNSKDYSKIQELYEQQNKLNLKRISIDYKLRILQTQINVEEFNLGITDNPYKDEQ